MENSMNILNSNRVLLISSVSQKSSGIGALFLRDLIGYCQDFAFYWHYVPAHFQGKNLDRLGRFGSIFRALLSRLSLWQALRLFIFEHFALTGQVTLIKRLIKDHATNHIVLTSSSPELIALGRQLVSHGHDVLVIVWDAPEYLTANLRLSQATTDRVQRDFADLMQGARAAAVVSEEMKNRYEEMYGIPCLIMRHGTDAVPRTDRAHAKDAIRIVFAGSLYAKQEWNAFVSALELADWKLAERDVRLIFIGNFPLTGATRPDRLECLPAVPHARALELMAEMDVGYLPYWFDEGHESVVRSSFPGKMTAYAAAGLAIFHHGPRYSTVTSFLEKYQIGIACGSLDASQILGALEELAKMLYTEKVMESRVTAMRDALSSDAMYAAFQSLLLTDVRTRNAVTDSKTVAEFVA